MHLDFQIRYAMSGSDSSHRALRRRRMTVPVLKPVEERSSRRLTAAALVERWGRGGERTRATDSNRAGPEGPTDQRRPPAITATAVPACSGVWRKAGERSRLQPGGGRRQCSTTELRRSHGGGTRTRDHRVSNDEALAITATPLMSVGRGSAIHQRTWRLRAGRLTCRYLWGVPARRLGAFWLFICTLPPFLKDGIESNATGRRRLTDPAQQ